jgi:hypothetical protein
VLFVFPDHVGFKSIAAGRQRGSLNGQAV